MFKVKTRTPHLLMLESKLKSVDIKWSLIMFFCFKFLITSGEDWNPRLLQRHSALQWLNPDVTTKKKYEVFHFPSFSFLIIVAWIIVSVNVNVYSVSCQIILRVSVTSKRAPWWCETVMHVVILSRADMWRLFLTDRKCWCSANRNSSL